MAVMMVDAADAAHDVQGPRGTVLIVDDEDDLREALATFLRSFIPGVTVHTAPGGQVGLDLLGVQHVDVIISDFKMPAMDGLEFLRLARATHPDTPAILITAFPDSAIEAAAVAEVGIARFIPKPFDPNALVEVVVELMA